jgi:hypothetical protein
MSLPNVSEAFWDLEDDVLFHVVKKSVDDFEAVDTGMAIVSFPAVVQPLNPRKLLIKPEGERKWNWLTLFTTMNLDLDSIIEDAAGRQYRVMSQNDWGGHKEYDITEQPA